MFVRMNVSASRWKRRLHLLSLTPSEPQADSSSLETEARVTSSSATLEFRCAGPHREQRARAQSSLSASARRVRVCVIYRYLRTTNRYFRFKPQQTTTTREQRPNFHINFNLNVNINIDINKLVILSEGLASRDERRRSLNRDGARGSDIPISEINSACQR